MITAAQIFYREGDLILSQFYGIMVIIKSHLRAELTARVRWEKIWSLDSDRILVLSSIFRKFVSDKMKSRAGIRRWSGYAPLNCLKAYAGGGVKSGEAVHLDS